MGHDVSYVRVVNILEEFIKSRLQICFDRSILVFEFLLIFSENVGGSIRVWFAGSVGVVTESFLLVDQGYGLKCLVKYV